jgi:glycosyltransferase involved in cell wall biosynthesis
MGDAEPIPLADGLAPSLLSPVHILFLTHYFPPEGNAPASRVSELCRRWVAAGHNVRVITGVPNVPSGMIYEGYRNRLWQRETWQGVEVLRVWTHVAPNKGTVRRTLSYLSFMVTAFLAGLCVRRPDVVLATSPQFFCGWAGALTAWFRRRPFILEIRDIWPESIAAVGAVKSQMAIRMLAWLERSLYRSAKRIVTVGAGYRDKLVERGVPPDKINIVMNGVDRELFKPDIPPTRVRSEFGLDGRFVCA